MIVLLIRAKNFNLVEGCPTKTNAGRTYTTVIFVAVLYITAITSLFLDWPEGPSGNYYDRKRHELSGGIGNGVSEGPVWGCFGVDLTFS